MPRRPNIQPTNIYWLFDMRPETLTIHPLGWPFYCGKTIVTVIRRFAQHRCAVAQYPERALSEMLSACGDHVRVEIMQVVAVGENWAERERSWIRTLRHLNPDCVNKSDGGDGVPGMIHTKASRLKMSIAKQNCTEETRRKLREYAKNRPLEVLAKIGAASRGRVDSDETRKRRRESHIGLVKSAETCRRIREAKLNQTEETRRKISEAKRGYKYSDAALAGIRAGQKRRREREVAAKFATAVLTSNKMAVS